MDPLADARSYFSLPLYPRARRSKRSKSPASSSSDDDHTAPGFDQPSWTSVNAPRPLSPGALAPGEAAPPSTDDPFHQPAILRRGRHTKAPRQLLAAYNLAPLPGVADGEVRSLSKRHLAVLITILYRCLLEGDYARAERAFACLVRYKDVDIRAVWGVGLELLLRRGDKDDSTGLKDAVEYLERLVLFYPYNPRLHSQHPVLHRPDAPPVKKDGKKRKKEPPPTRERLPPNPSAIEFQPALFSLLIEGSRWRDVAAPQGDEEELQITRPERIRERLEELMLTPPWSDMVALVCLRGMVCLWMADIEVEGGTARDAESVVELRRAAKRDFEAVKEKGGVVPESVWEAATEEEMGDEEMVDV
jgi:hypothetical protein